MFLILIDTNLCTQVRYDNKLLQDIFGKNVGEAGFFDVVGSNANVVGSEMKVGSRDGPDTPLSLGRECLSLVVGGCGDYNFISMFIDCASGGGCDLTLFFGLFLDLCYLLSLLGRRTDLHAQDDVPDFRICQRGHIHTAIRSTIASIVNRSSCITVILTCFSCYNQPR